MVDITLAIVTYNNENIIKETLESILASIPSSYSSRVFVIDNKSTDRTRDILKSFHDRIDLINLEENIGFSRGHNVIMNQLKSKYHFVINPDIILPSQFEITRMIDFMNQNECVGLLSPKILNMDGSIQYLCKHNPTIFDLFIRRLMPWGFRKRQDFFVMKETGYNRTMPIEYATGCFMLFRTQVYQELEGFDKNFFLYLEDADITRRVNEKYKSIYFPDAKVYHKWQRMSYKKLKFFIINIQSIFVYFKKWGWKWR